MTLIRDVRLRRVLDSRGEPTVEADVHTDREGFGRAAAPSGASTGEHEAVELPPKRAIARARERALPRLEGEVYAGDQRSVDRALHAADGTENFSEIGANSAVAISMAAAKAAADVLGAPLFQHLGGAFRGEQLPTPLGNVIGGGEHAADATDIQEFLAVPTGAPSAADAVFANAAVHREVGDVLADRGLHPGRGDEGAWAPSIDDREALEVLATATDRVTEEVGFAVEMGLDVAASELYADDAYEYTNQVRLRAEQIDHVESLVEEYDLVYVEDPLDEDDVDGYAELTDRVGDRTTICGDDLFVTDDDRLREGVAAGAANAVLVKPNQAGTLTDAVDCVDAAHEAGYAPVVSHRSGETEDATIAHLAAAVGAPMIKTGTVGGERTAKLNELIRIEHDT
jgi:enolase